MQNGTIFETAVIVSLFFFLVKTDMCNMDFGDIVTISITIATIDFKFPKQRKS